MACAGSSLNDTGPVAPHSLQRTASATGSSSISITAKSSLAQCGHSSAVFVGTGPPVTRRKPLTPRTRAPCRSSSVEGCYTDMSNVALARKSSSTSSITAKCCSARSRRRITKASSRSAPTHPTALADSRAGSRSRTGVTRGAVPSSGEADQQMDLLHRNAKVSCVLQILCTRGQFPVITDNLLYSQTPVTKGVISAS